MNIALLLYIIIILDYAIINLLMKNGKKKDKFFLASVFIILIIVLAIRTPYSDAMTYLDYYHRFDKASSFSLINRFEPLFQLFNYILNKLLVSDRVYLIITAILTSIGPYFVIRKYSKNYLLSTLLFVAIGSYSAQFYLLREALAVSIALFSISYIIDRKFLKFCIVITVASLFHLSALILLPVYFVARLNVKKQMIVAAPFFVIAFILRDYFYNFLNFTSYSGYLGGAYDNAGSGFYKLAMIALIFIFCIVFYNKNNKKESAQRRTTDGNDVFLALITYSLFIQINATQMSLMTRLVDYLCIAYIILPVNDICGISDEHTKRIITTIILAFAFLYIATVEPIQGYSTIFEMQYIE